MLSIKPNQRPTIVEVLNKSFIRKRLTAFFNDAVSGPPAELSPTDVDDVAVCINYLMIR
jgi:hypothetical protein